MLDLLITVPFFVFLALEGTSVRPTGAVRWLGRLCRLARALRVFRFVRDTAAGVTLKRTLAAAAPFLGVLCAVWVAALVFFACLVFWVEPVNSYMDSIPEAMWWAVATLTTVGYAVIVSKFHSCSEEER
ncbi:potassium voltage-gated channel subfamily A member 7-like [Pollicipes pollicipes]|uniref:potassium voltage-gated channel subfamily A member 7-like n=1 Tax=Pollicipes pollicipes TaxID=41117 RepID=UPI0018849F88|nr:potassium voltage-gated channel subfamily A member 7-like [Pollicipes pollicipes]